MFLETAIALVLILYLCTLLGTNVWKIKKVPHDAPLPIFGNFLEASIRTKTMYNLLKEKYEKFYSKRYFGFYQFSRPILVVKDLELIKQITVKDFDHFSEHSAFMAENLDPIWDNNLFAMKAHKWKQMRPTLSPAFTSNKMRFMFELMEECANNFTNNFVKYNENVITVELKDIFTKYTNDVIASTAFGLDCDTVKNPENDFYKNGKSLANFRGFRFFINRLSPTLQRILNMKLIDDDKREYFANVIKNILKLRREQGFERKDIIQLLLQAQKGEESKNEIINNEQNFAAKNEEILVNDKEKKRTITDNDIISQAILFFIAGFDTASTLMSMTGYELMKNPEIQSCLRDEIDSVFENNEGKITYEDIMGMKYLDMVISESLRKWPPIPIVDRKCTKEYTIKQVNSDEETVVIEKDMIVWLPAHALQRDPELYENPDKFDPERFNEENKRKINPYAYIAFGSGPRNCIGSRFALLENKILFVHLLRKFEIVPASDNFQETQWDTRYLSYYPKNGFQMALKKRNY